MYVTWATCIWNVTELKYDVEASIYVSTVQYDYSAYRSVCRRVCPYSPYTYPVFLLIEFVAGIRAKQTEHNRLARLYLIPIYILITCEQYHRLTYKHYLFEHVKTEL